MRLVVKYSAICNVSPRVCAQYVLGVLSFFTIALGGVAVGAIVGAGTAFLLKFASNARGIQNMLL